MLHECLHQNSVVHEFATTAAEGFNDLSNYWEYFIVGEETTAVMALRTRSVRRRAASFKPACVYRCGGA
jgi:hypothetical protein